MFESTEKSTLPSLAENQRIFALRQQADKQNQERQALHHKFPFADDDDEKSWHQRLSTMTQPETMVVDGILDFAPVKGAKLTDLRQILCTTMDDDPPIIKDDEFDPAIEGLVGKGIAIRGRGDVEVINGQLVDHVLETKPVDPYLRLPPQVTSLMII